MQDLASITSAIPIWLVCLKLSPHVGDDLCTGSSSSDVSAMQFPQATGDSMEKARAVSLDLMYCCTFRHDTGSMSTGRPLGRRLRLLIRGAWANLHITRAGCKGLINLLERQPKQGKCTLLRDGCATLAKLMGASNKSG